MAAGGAFVQGIGSTPASSLERRSGFGVAGNPTVQTWLRVMHPELLARSRSSSRRAPLAGASRDPNRQGGAGASTALRRRPAPAAHGHADAKPESNGGLGMITRTTAALAAAFAATGIVAWRQKRAAGWRRSVFRRSTASTAPTTPTIVPTAPTAMATLPTLVASQGAVEPAILFKAMLERCDVIPRTIERLPAWLPMVLLSAYTTVPLMAMLGACVCPNPARMVRALAAALGCLLGTAAGQFLERAKKDAARCSVLRVLATHAQDRIANHELRALVKASRQRFRVGVEQRGGVAFEDTSLRGIYENMLTALLDGPENDPQDLPTLQRIKAALALDGVVVGLAHRRAAQVLVSKGYSGVEGEELRAVVNKLLFLSERAFSEDEPEEARLYEMGRVRAVMKVSEKDSQDRIAEVSRAHYQQALSAVVDKVDSHTAEALSGASATFGLAREDAARMNSETYKQIAAGLLGSGRLASDGMAALERAKGVLQLSEREAMAAFITVASPILQKDVDEVAKGIQDQAEASSADNLKEAARKLASRCQELGLSLSSGCSISAEGFVAAVRELYSDACKAARNSQDVVALGKLDKILSFVTVADNVLAELSPAATEDAVADNEQLTFTADEANARRLYGIYLERSLSDFGRMIASGAMGNATMASPEELARVFEMTEADQEAARIEVCQPKLRQLFIDCIEESEAAAGEGVPLSKAKAKLEEELVLFKLPLHTIEETALDVYKSRVEKISGRVISGDEKSSLDAALDFLSLSQDDVRLIHLKAFKQVFEISVQEAMGRDGVMLPESKEALQQLSRRLGLLESDAERIFYGVVEARLKEMMGKVKEAWEEATYSKEALTQLYKSRGQDVGEDLSADGTGGTLGIQESVPMEGVRGGKLMDEFLEVVQFYEGNGVMPVKKEGSPPSDDDYPVKVGAYLESKSKEEMYGIFAWNAVTCQDSFTKEKWERAKPHVGGILGLSQADQKKVMVRMVSRWANMFIKQRMEDKGELGKDDIQTLTEWVPMYFGIDKEVTKEMVQSANRTMLQAKVLRLLNKPKVTTEDVQKLRSDVEAWDLTIQKDLELTKPQLRLLFRAEVLSALEDPKLTAGQKLDAVASGKEGFSLGDDEAEEELHDLVNSRCKGYLINAVGDLMQGNETQAVLEMQRLELLATFAEETEGMVLSQDWEVAPAMMRRLVDIYLASASASGSGKQPNSGLLQRVLLTT